MSKDTIGVFMVLSLAGAASFSPWLALFAVSLAGSAWMAATAFDDLVRDWRGVWRAGLSRWTQPF